MPTVWAGMWTLQSGINLWDKQDELWQGCCAFKLNTHTINCYNLVCMLPWFLVHAYFRTCVSIFSASDVSWYNCIFHSQDLDIVTKQLLAKAGESNNFIRDDVEQSLSSMVEGVTPQRSLLALIAGGATWVHVFWGCFLLFLFMSGCTCLMVFRPRKMIGWWYTSQFF